MANPDHLALVIGDPRHLFAWQHANPMERLDLSGADLTGRDLAGYDLYMADLRGTDLRGANLEGARLQGTRLEGARLSEANLKMADLAGANLTRAEIREAYCSQASCIQADLRQSNFNRSSLDLCDFSRADLREANLSETTLRYAVFTGAELDGTTFTGSYILKATFADCDLSRCIGLAEAQYDGPSSLGIDTILRSRGVIPTEFLRGIGLPDVVVDYVQSLAKRPLEYYSCFISHSSRDREFCDRLYTDLGARGIKTWYFPQEARWGKGVWEEIDEAIRVYDKVIVVCSEASLVGEGEAGVSPVAREIERALRREDRERRHVLFPIRLDDYIFRWEHPRQADITAKVVGDFTRWREPEAYAAALEKLITELRRSD